MIKKLLLPLVLITVLTARSVFADAEEVCDEDFPWCAVADSFVNSSNIYDWTTLASIADWLETKSLGAFPSTADGVMKLTYGALDDGGPGAYRVANLPAGTYRIRFRMGTDVPGWMLWKTFDPHIHVSLADTDTEILDTYFDGSRARDIFVAYETAPFTITGESLVKVAFDVDHLGRDHAAYLDYVIVGQDYGDANNPSAPTPTAIPVTPQSTSIPAPHSLVFCIQPTPTPAPPVYGQPTPAPPDPERQWGILNDDGIIFGDWSAGGDAIEATHVKRSSENMFRISWSYSTSSVAVGFSADAGASMSDMTRAALVFAPTSITITTPFTATWWAKADSVPVSTEAYTELWAHTGGSWTRLTEKQVSSGGWVQHYSTISGNVDAIAWTFRRSSGTSGFGYVDDINVFGDRAFGIQCNGMGGTYPPAVRLAGSDHTYGDRVIPEGEGLVTLIPWPLGKPCPPTTVEEPNNFWGPLLASFTLMLDRLTAPFPAHEQNGAIGAIQTLVSAPIWQIPSLAATLLDLTPILAATLTIISLEIVRSMLTVWFLVMKIIPLLPK